MALTPRLSNEAANAEANAAVALAQSGVLRIYDGSQPANADASIGGANVLATLNFTAGSFGAATLGVSSLTAAISDASADLTGTAAWFRVWKSGGTAPLWDGSVGTTADTPNLVLDNNNIVIGGVVSVTAFTFTASKT